MAELNIKGNEVLLRDEGGWLHFSAPYRVIAASKLESVMPALQEVEWQTQVNGRYAAGFLSYEAAPAFDPALQTRSDSGLPYLWFGLYPKPCSVVLPQPKGSKEIFDWHPTIDRQTYNAAVAEIKDHIAEGRTYQVNYTMRLRTDFDSSAWEFFLHLAQNQNTHAAYLDLDRYVICSVSPELFFQLNGNRLVCRPMKGTTKRGRTTTEDQKESEWLKGSTKNRAENVMIVDMIRNDLGRIAEVGSVSVPRLFETERYATLWQMTSTVNGRTNAPLTEIFRALFPCASITGAPKVSTMKIIAELESTPRRIYTGSIGYIAPGRKAKFSVAIRTALIDWMRHEAEYGIGGGIVWDSTSKDEYAEALLKARVLLERPRPFSLLETILWMPDEGYFLRQKHLRRMLDSADYFGILITAERIDEYLDQLASPFRVPQRVRMLLDQSGRLDAEFSPIEIAENIRPLRVSLAKEPLDTSSVFLFHKTTQRDAYELATKGFEELDDVLLYNEAGELTEFTIGNLVVELDDQLFTPPISCGVLAGTFRAHLLETGQVLEKTIPVGLLTRAKKIFRVNSIRRWQRVEIER